MRLTIGELRKRAGLTQGELSERIGITRPYLSQLENGERKLSAALRQRIIEALDVEPLSVAEAHDSFTDRQILLMAYEKLPKTWQKSLVEMARAYLEAQQKL